MEGPRHQHLHQEWQEPLEERGDQPGATIICFKKTKPSKDGNGQDKHLHAPVLGRVHHVPALRVPTTTATGPAAHQQRFSIVQRALGATTFGRETINIEALCAATTKAHADSPSQMPLSCPVVRLSQRELHKDGGGGGGGVAIGEEGRAPPGPRRPGPTPNPAARPPQRSPQRPAPHPSRARTLSARPSRVT